MYQISTTNDPSHFQDLLVSIETAHLPLPLSSRVQYYLMNGVVSYLQSTRKSDNTVLLQQICVIVIVHYIYLDDRLSELNKSDKISLKSEKMASSPPHDVVQPPPSPSLGSRYRHFSPASTRIRPSKIRASPFHSRSKSASLSPTLAPVPLSFDEAVEGVQEGNSSSEAIAEQKDSVDDKKDEEVEMARATPFSEEAPSRSQASSPRLVVSKDDSADSQCAENHSADVRVAAMSPLLHSSGVELIRVVFQVIPALAKRDSEANILEKIQKTFTSAGYS